MYTGAAQDEYQGEPPPGHARQPRGETVAMRRVRRRRRFAWLGALLLLPVTVPLVFRGFDVSGPPPVPQLLAFLPWLLAPGWLALVCAVLARRWLVAFWALAALGATGWFLQPYGPDAPSPSDAAPTARFRVLTANLQYGGAIDALLAALRTERPQLVFVQECDRLCADTLRTSAVREDYPHRIITDESGAAGSALLSTYPLHTRPPVSGALSMPGAVADIAGVRVGLQLAHPMPPVLSDLGPWRRELDNLRSYAASHSTRPTILAGDFNASQDHAAFRAILDTGLRDAARLQGQSRTPTWPTLTAPPLGAQIDHVLVSERFEAHEAKFLDFPGSDHRALLVDLKLFPTPRL